MHIAVTWAIILIVMFVGLAQVAPVQAQGTGSCRYLYPDGSVSGELFVSLEVCAKTILDETIRIGQTEGYGLYDKYALRVYSNGDVYAAQTEFARSDDELQWQYLGNLRGQAQAAPQPQQPAQSPQPAAPQSPSTPDGQTRGVVPTSLQQIFDIAAEDINDFWAEVFKEYNYDYTQPRIVLHNRSQISTGCGTAPAQVGPFYCNVDHTMYYPQWFMDQQWQQIGDYAVVVIVAHEWAHAVQSMLGRLTQGDYTINIELQADCLAGAYTQYANERSTKIRLDRSDIEEGANALFHAGDPYGTPWWDQQAHGTGDQRYEAFADGFKSGVSAC
jgi:hypothetical protein